MTERASQAYFIKLGRAGEWEAECLRDEILRLGFVETPPGLCAEGNWEQVRNFWQELHGNAGVATRYTRQIRSFYEADEHTVFITFVGGLLRWCRPAGPVERLEDGGHWRRTVDGWRSTSVGNVPLTTDRLSGHLLMVQMFEGAICRVSALDYLLRKLNDQPSPQAAAAIDAENALVKGLIELMRLLTWQDFELLVDLAFTNSGWRRVSVVGRSQQTVDLELVLPTTEERAFVQIKSEASNDNLERYVHELRGSSAYDRMFFVWHTGNVNAVQMDGKVTLVGPDRLARMVMDAGLSSWLRAKSM